MRTKQNIPVQVVDGTPEFQNDTDEFLVLFERVAEPPSLLIWEEHYNYHFEWTCKTAQPVFIYVLAPGSAIDLEMEVANGVAGYCNFIWHNSYDPTDENGDEIKRFNKINEFKTVWDIASWFVAEMEYADG